MLHAHFTMERWSGRVAVITGASSGIGAAIAYQLQDQGLIVVALARRVEKIQESVEKARKDAQDRNRYKEPQVIEVSSSMCCCSSKRKSSGMLYPRQCDVQKEVDIVSTFKWVKDTFGQVDILVNNAGVVGEDSLTESETSKWQRIIDTNVLGLSICTREAVKIMREKGVDDGHIIHVSSVAGHIMPFSGSVAMYSASKHAVRALTEGLRKYFVENKKHIKITSISPGVVLTEIVTNTVHSLEDFENLPHLQPEDVADAVLFTLDTPPHVQIHEIIIKPVGEAF